MANNPQMTLERRWLQDRLNILRHRVANAEQAIDRGDRADALKAVVAAEFQIHKLIEFLTNVHDAGPVTPHSS